MTASLAAAEIARRARGIKPRIAIVLGSGLGSIATRVEEPVVIPYAALPGFPMPTVEGHAARITLGHIGDTQVALMLGRHHAYEGEDKAGLRTFVRAMRQIGCETVVLTGAAGSLQPEVGPGRLMAVVDHINLTGANPLIGPNDRNFGPRYFSLADAYDPQLRACLTRTAERLDINLASGVYAATLGPSFETPAEVRMLRILGADAVGMSIVSECIVARHCGLRVAACVVITNWGEGMASGPVNHGPTIRVPAEAAADLERLLVGFLDDFAPNGSRA